MSKQDEKWNVWWSLRGGQKIMRMIKLVWVTVVAAVVMRKVLILTVGEIAEIGDRTMLGKLNI